MREIILPAAWSARLRAGAAFGKPDLIAFRKFALGLKNMLDRSSPAGRRSLYCRLAY